MYRRGKPRLNQRLILAHVSNHLFQVAREGCAQNMVHLPLAFLMRMVECTVTRALTQRCVYFFVLVLNTKAVCALRGGCLTPPHVSLFL